MGGCLIAYAGAGSEAAKNAPATRHSGKEGPTEWEDALSPTPAPTAKLHKNAPATRNRNKGDRAEGVVEPLLQSGKEGLATRRIYVRLSHSRSRTFWRSVRV